MTAKEYNLIFEFVQAMADSNQGHILNVPDTPAVIISINQINKLLERVRMLIDDEEEESK